MDRRAFLIAAAGGAVLQLALVVAGHFVVAIADNLFAVGGALISLAAGLAYARLARSRARRVAWGALAAAIGAVIAIAVSAALDDVHPIMLLLGGLASAAAGAAGAALAALRPRRTG